MIKGVSRRVIVVRAPDTTLFEQAIFLLREDAPEVSDAQVLRQACRAADDYVRARAEKRPRRTLRRADRADIADPERGGRVGMSAIP